MRVGIVGMELYVVFFFFQAEDGIRDYKVTGVQTCALPICADRLTASSSSHLPAGNSSSGLTCCMPALLTDRKSTRLNSSHLVISYAVFCLKKKKKSSITDVHTAAVTLCTPHHTQQALARAS